MQESQEPPQSADIIWEGSSSRLELVINVVVLLWLSDNRVHFIHLWFWFLQMLKSESGLKSREQGDTAEERWSRYLSHTGTVCFTAVAQKIRPNT